MHFSVITAASRDVETMKRLREQFRKQTFTDFEHIIVYDGPPPADVQAFFDTEGGHWPGIHFAFLPERDGRYGTGPRNRGIEMAKGEFLVFADDDDLYHPDYLRAFADLGLTESDLGVVRMSNYGTVVPRHSMRSFPRNHHVGTPSCCYPAGWLREYPELRWDFEDGYAHDFAFVRRFVDRVKPRVCLNPRVVVKAGNEKLFEENGLFGNGLERYLSWTEPTPLLQRFGPARSDEWCYRTMYDVLRYLSGVPPVKE